MDCSIIETLSPQQAELKKRLAELSHLENRFGELELILATARAELEVFFAEYKRLIGARYAELDEIEAQIAELIAALAPSDKNAQANKTQARERAQRTASEMGAEDPDLRQVSPKTQRRFAAASDVRALFREIAKRIHPDLAEDSDSVGIRTRLMAEAIDAYRSGDVAALNSILERWEQGPEVVPGSSVEAELERVVRKIRQLSKQIDHLEMEWRQLQESDMYRLKVEVEQKNMIGIDLFQEMCNELDKRILKRRERLQEMMERFRNADGFQDEANRAK